MVELIEEITQDVHQPVVKIKGCYFNFEIEVINMLPSGTSPAPSGGFVPSISPAPVGGFVAGMLAAKAGDIYSLIEGGLNPEQRYPEGHSDFILEVRLIWQRKFPGNPYPIQLRFRHEVGVVEEVEGKKIMAAAPPDNIYRPPNQYPETYKIGSERYRIARGGFRGVCRAAVARALAYLSTRPKGRGTNAHRNDAIAHIFDLLIQPLLILPNANTQSPGTLKEIIQYIDFLDDLRRNPHLFPKDGILSIFTGPGNPQAALLDILKTYGFLRDCLERIIAKKSVESHIDTILDEGRDIVESGFIFMSRIASETLVNDEVGLVSIATLKGAKSIRPSLKPYSPFSTDATPLQRCITALANSLAENFLIDTSVRLIEADTKAIEVVEGDLDEQKLVRKEEQAKIEREAAEAMAKAQKQKRNFLQRLFGSKSKPTERPVSLPTSPSTVSASSASTTLTTSKPIKKRTAVFQHIDVEEGGEKFKGWRLALPDIKIGDPKSGIHPMLQKERNRNFMMHFARYGGLLEMLAQVIGYKGPIAKLKGITCEGGNIIAIALDPYVREMHADITLLIKGIIASYQALRTEADKLQGDLTTAGKPKDPWIINYTSALSLIDPSRENEAVFFGLVESLNGVLRQLERWGANPTSKLRDLARDCSTFIDQVESLRCNMNSFGGPVYKEGQRHHPDVFSKLVTYFTGAAYTVGEHELAGQLLHTTLRSDKSLLEVGSMPTASGEKKETGEGKSESSAAVKPSAAVATLDETKRAGSVEPPEGKGIAAASAVLVPPAVTTGEELKANLKKACSDLKSTLASQTLISGGDPVKKRKQASNALALFIADLLAIKGTTQKRIDYAHEITKDDGGKGALAYKLIFSEIDFAPKLATLLDEQLKREFKQYVIYSRKVATNKILLKNVRSHVLADLPEGKTIIPEEARIVPDEFIFALVIAAGLHHLQRKAGGEGSTYLPTKLVKLCAAIDTLLLQEPLSLLGEDFKFIVTSARKIFDVPLVSSEPPTLSSPKKEGTESKAAAATSSAPLADTRFDLQLMFPEEGKYAEAIKHWKQRHKKGDVLIIRNKDKWEAHVLKLDEKQVALQTSAASSRKSPILPKYMLAEKEHVEIDVPGDGTCLFYSIALSVLLPVVRNQHAFNASFAALFRGTSMSKETIEALRVILLTYRGEADFITHHKVLLELIDVRFRQNLVKFMQEKTNKKIFADVNYTDEKEDFEKAMARMGQPKEWGGHREVEAASQFLKRRIIVHEEKKDTGELVERASYGTAYVGTPIYLLRTSSTKLSKVVNHYHYLLPSEHFSFLSAEEKAPVISRAVEAEIEVKTIKADSPLVKELANVTRSNVASFRKATIRRLLSTSLENFAPEIKSMESKFAVMVRELADLSKLSTDQLLKIATKNLNAQYILGNRYERGIDVSVDLSQALRWYTSAASKKHPLAMYELAWRMYCGEDEIEKDVTQAKQLFSKALPGLRLMANMEDHNAQAALARCCDEGWGTKQCEVDAVKWYQRAADHGNPVAQFNLGVCYTDGTGVTQDHNQALKWYNASAMQGAPPAQFRLGWCYEKGLGIGQDLHQAAIWYEKAAQQGFVQAQSYLVKLTQKNTPLAKLLWQKRAENGDVDAQLNLGVHYADKAFSSYLSRNIIYRVMVPPMRRKKAAMWCKKAAMWCKKAANGGELSAYILLLDIKKASTAVLMSTPLPAASSSMAAITTGRLASSTAGATSSAAAATTTAMPTGTPANASPASGGTSARAFALPTPLAPPSVSTAGAFAAAGAPPPSLPGASRPLAATSSRATPIL